MAHDAFLSYSKDDKETVDGICKALEENGLSCWYAPRNVPIGADWDDSIMEALAASRVMILVWSTHSDQSKQVKREVALALDDMGVTVIPFRTESIEPSKLRYYLNSIQWLDASSPPPEANLQRLVEQVRIAIPMVGQLLASPAEQRERSQTGAGEADEESPQLREVEALQEAEAEAVEEAEAAAYRHSRMLAEVESLRHAGPGILPPAEAEILRRAAEAEAVKYGEGKARLLAKVESLHQAVATALKRAEIELGEKQPEAETAFAADAKNKQ